MFAKENVILSFSPDKKSTESVDGRNVLRTKLGLSSGSTLSPSEFFVRQQHFNEMGNILEDNLTAFNKPFSSLIRDDLWVLDPMAMRVCVSYSLNLTISRKRFLIR